MAVLLDRVRGGFQHQAGVAACHYLGVKVVLLVLSKVRALHSKGSAEAGGDEFAGDAAQL